MELDYLIGRLPEAKPDEEVFGISAAAKRAGRTPRGLRHAIQDGLVHEKYLRVGKFKTGTRTRIMVTGEGVAEYKKLAPFGRNNGASTTSDKSGEKVAVGGMPDNLAAAKLRVEQLKIERLEAENMIARNETMRIEDVIAINQEVDLELVAALKKLVFRAAPRLLGKNDIAQVRKILEQEIQEAMSILQRDPDPRVVAEAEGAPQ